MFNTDHCPVDSTPNDGQPGLDKQPFKPALTGLKWNLFWSVNPSHSGTTPSKTACEMILGLTYAQPYWWNGNLLWGVRISLHLNS